MISGKINNLSQYISPEIAEEILLFLKERDIAALPSSKYELSKGIFAIVIKTKSRIIDKQTFEAHEKYLDLHYLFSGKEIICFNSGALIIDKPYNSDMDVVIYRQPSKYSFLELDPGQCVIFFPEEAHCAQIHFQKPGELIKVVFKIPALKDSTCT